MRIAITGGTGFIGRAITRALLQGGHEPWVLRRARRSFSSAPPRRPLPGAEIVPVDFSRPEALAAALSGTDAIIHLVGIIAEAGSQTYERVHVEGTSTMLSAATRAGVRRWIHMSALGTRPDARSRYHRSKWEAEEHVRRSALDWTIFRPSLVYGPEDLVTEFFSRMSRWSPVLPVMGAGTALLQPVAATNVAQAFLGSLTHPPAVSRTYDLCGCEQLTFPQLLRAILAAQGRRRALVHVPMPVARCQAAVMEWIWPRVFGSPPPLNRDQLLMLEEDNIGDGTPADVEFGLVHRPLVDALRGQFARSLAPGT